MERKKVHSKHHIVLQFLASAKGEGKGRKGERKEEKKKRNIELKGIIKIYLFLFVF